MASNMEQELIARCRGGEPAAWDEVFDRHYAATGRFVFQLGHDLTREDVEEICQETFLAVIRSLEKFQGGCQLQTWIFRIAGNQARDFRERKQAAKRGGGQTPLSLNAEDPETGLTLDAPSTAAGPAEALLSAEQARLVQVALEELPVQCREVIEMRYFGDLSYEEISLALELNAKTVSSRLSKCLDKLEAIGRRIFSGEKNPVFPSN